MLTGTAGSIALINALGNLGGFFGSYVFGLIKDATGGSFVLGLVAISMGPVLSGSLVLALGCDRRLENIRSTTATDNSGGERCYNVFGRLARRLGV
jgi:MFS transporter, ACS family, tartrate transporter